MSLPIEAPESELTDAKLLVRTRKLVRGNCAGYHGDTCVEPCSPHVEGQCSYFQEHPRRCPFFEKMVLPRADSNLYDAKPLDEGLGEAYNRHVRFGEAVQVRRCQWPRCRKETAGVGPASKFCAFHAELSRKQAVREASRRYREKQQNGSSVIKLAAGALDK